MLYKGSQKIEKIYKGSTRLWRAYKGSQLVFGYEPNDVLFESSTAGTYTFNMEYGARVNVILVGGGGGGARMYSGYGTQKRAGGSAGMVTGEILLEAGTYTITIGGGGTGRSANDNVSGDAGGNSTFLGNTAGGGGGAYCNVWSGTYRAGSAGTASAVSGFTASNGTAGSTTSRYGSYGGGGVVDGGNGQNGYCKITVLQEV